MTRPDNFIMKRTVDDSANVCFTQKLFDVKFYKFFWKVTQEHMYIINNSEKKRLNND